MYKLILFLSVVMCVATTLPTAAQAGPIIRTGDKISVESSQTLEGDFYGFGSTVTVSGPAQNDVYVAGGTVTINAPVEEDLVVVGGVVQVHGDVQDDVRIVGGEVTLAKAVKGDVVVLGGTLTILSTASVGGDILFMGGDLVINGDVAGSIHGTSDTVRINARVDGDVLYTSTKALTLGDDASITGNVTYTGIHDIVRAQNASVTGTITKNDAVVEGGSTLLKVLILQVLIVLFAGLAGYLIGRKHLQAILERTGSALGIPGLIGIGVFILVPFVSIVCMVSVVGLLVGVVLLVSYAALLIVSLPFAGIMVGYHLQRMLRKQTVVTPVTVIGGIVVFSLLHFIPFVGGLLTFAGIMVALGVLCLTGYRLVRA